MKLRLLLFLWICTIFSCKTDVKTEQTEQVETSTQSVLSPDGTLSLPTWAHNANIYEVNVRQYTDKGDFATLGKHLPRLDKMGVDILWLMPIHPISMKNRKAKGDLNVEDIEDEEERKKYLGSPYSVADYKAVNPEFGTMQDFKDLVDLAHTLGMKVIIDWVPNHTGWDNPWITEHPEWYTQDADGNIIDPIDYNTGKSWGWTDVADLNYENQEMRKEMISSMQFWLDEADIDGFRVDVAHGIPQDFWDQVTPALVSSKNDIFLLAESEVPSHRNNNTYHADYGWSFHHLINDISKGEKQAKDIDEWMTKNRATYQKGIHIHFTSNHDENTWAGTAIDRMGDAHKTMAAFTATFDGMPLIYGGQEEPLRHRLEFFEKDTIGFKDYAYSDFYAKLLKLKHDNQALWNGEHGGELVKLLEHDDIYAFKREKDGDKVIGVFNLSDKIQEFVANEGLIVNEKEVISGDQISWNMDQKIEMQPWGYYLFSGE